MKKRLKRALSLFVAALMLCAMLPAALAADGEPPLYEYVGFDSPQELMEYWFGETEFNQADYDWLSTRYTENLAACEADEQVMRDYWGYTLPTAAEVQGVSLEDLPKETAWNMAQYAYYEYKWQEGNYGGCDWGEPPTLSVQLNGETVDFADAQPETADNRTMVPFRAMIEKMGGTVGYDKGRVTAKVGEVTAEFTLGSDKLYWTGPDGDAPEGLMTEAGGAKYLTMDVKPYEKNDRTYVPVRFFAEAFGLTVKWDERELTAVVYDRQALTDSIDKDFAVMNEFIAAQPKLDPAQAMRTAMTIAVQYTAFNSIDGNETFPMTGKLNVLTEGDSFEMDLKLDLYAMVRLMADQTGRYMDEESLSQMTKAIALLKGDLENASFDMIYNADDNTLYFRCPLLFKVMAMAGFERADKGGNDVWVRINDAFDETLFEAAKAYGTISEDGTAPTLGTVIMAMGENAYSDWYASGIWDYVTSAADSLKLFVGDAMFTKNGQTYTAKYDVTPDENGTGLARELYGSDIAYLKGFITLDMRQGSISAKLDIRDQSYWSDQLLTYEAEANAQSGTVYMSMHTKNVGILEIKVEIEQKASTQAPAQRPPEGDAVVDLDELMGTEEAQQS